MTSQKRGGVRQHARSLDPPSNEEYPPYVHSLSLHYTANSTCTTKKFFTHILTENLKVWLYWQRFAFLWTV